MLSRLDRLLHSEKPDAIIIFGGINDFICGLQPEQVAANYMAIIHQSVHYRVKPIIGISPAFNTEAIKEGWSNFSDFEQVLIKHKQCQKRLIQMSKAFRLEAIDLLNLISGNQVTNQTLFLDGLHLSARGHEMVAERILQSLSIEKAA